MKDKPGSAELGSHSRLGSSFCPFKPLLLTKHQA